MRSSIRTLLPLLAVAFPFVIAAACASSESITDPPSGASGATNTKGGAGGGAGEGQAGEGQAGEGQGGEAGSGDSGQGGESAAGAGAGGAAPGGSGGKAGAGAGGSGGKATGGAGQGAGGSGGSAAGGAGQGGAASGGQAGAAQGGAAQGGAAGKAGGWPTCDTQPAGSKKTQVPDVWAENPGAYSPVWLEGLTVTAVSFGACNPTGNFQCILFLQTKPKFGSLSEGKHQGIKLFVSEKASPKFVGLGVGDVVNVYGNAVRYTQFGQNELRIHVDLEHPGCAKAVGTATPEPIKGVALEDMTIDNYENAIGPLLVQVDSLKGRPTPDPTETFALFKSEQEGGFDAGLDLTEVLTPYYLPSGKFLNLTADKWTTFPSITGVYSVFVISDGGQFTKYRTLGPRLQSEIVQAP